ncbi:MAG TPA: hypothetical protein PK765_07505 [bacterium]|nr:hypothetical protein [bacterium]
MKYTRTILLAATLVAMPLHAGALYVEGEDPGYADDEMHIMSETSGSNETESSFVAQDICESIGGEFIVHMVVTPLGGAACILGDREVSLESLEDKYREYEEGVMIHYVSEWKYSESSKWDDIMEFSLHDIEDTKAFRQMDISDEAKDRIDEKLPIMERIYEVAALEESLGERSVKFLSDALSRYELRFPESELPGVYARLETRLEQRIESIRNEIMVSHYTPEGYAEVERRLNGYRYLLLLVQGRI